MHSFLDEPLLHIFFKNCYLHLSTQCGRKKAAHVNFLASCTTIGSVLFSIHLIECRFLLLGTGHTPFCASGESREKERETEKAFVIIRSKLCHPPRTSETHAMLNKLSHSVTTSPTTCVTHAYDRGMFLSSPSLYSPLRGPWCQWE